MTEEEQRRRSLRTLRALRFVFDRTPVALIVEAIHDTGMSPEEAQEFLRMLSQDDRLALR